MRPRFSVLVLSMLSACSAPDPAQELAVALQSGRHDIVVGGGTLVQFSSESAHGSKCFVSADAADFKRRPLAIATRQWPGCTETVEPSAGNAIAGKRRCPHRKAPVTVTFAGSHTTDRFTLEGEVKQGDDEGGGIMRLGSGPFRSTRPRTRVCGSE